MVLGAVAGFGLTAARPRALLRARRRGLRRRAARPPPRPRSCARRSTTTRPRADALARVRHRSSSPTTRGSACSRSRSASRPACRRPAAVHERPAARRVRARSTSERGLALEFWAWVLPHGVTELLAVVLCGAAGLRRRGAALPGPPHAARQPGRRGREAGVVVLGAVLMLLLAGLIEGIFRQTVHDVDLRCWSRRCRRCSGPSTSRAGAGARGDAVTAALPGRTGGRAREVVTPEGVPLRFTAGRRRRARGAPSLHRPGRSPVSTVVHRCC